MTLIGSGFSIETHNTEIFNIDSKFIYNGLQGFAKDCAYKPSLSVNLEGYINYRQEFYSSGSIPYSFRIQIYLSYSDVQRLISEAGDYLEKTKGSNPPAAWTLTDNRIKGVNPVRTLTNLETPLIFNQYKVAPDGQIEYQETGELFALTSFQLLEVRTIS